MQLLGRVSGLVNPAREPVVLQGDLLQEPPVGAGAEGQAEDGCPGLRVGGAGRGQDAVGAQGAHRREPVRQEHDEGLRGRARRPAMARPPLEVTPRGELQRGPQGAADVGTWGTHEGNDSQRSS